MQRYHQSHDLGIDQLFELTRQTAFHEAGHAAAIYLGNQLRGLPPVYFSIEVKRSEKNAMPLQAKVLGGHLIQSLPVAMLDNLADLSAAEKHSYQCAYEADVINLLAGPLAEARYVSIRDDEVLNLNLLSTQALGEYYGGQADMEKAYQYLEYFIADAKQRDEKMLELFAQAWMFVSHRKSWVGILNLANYILESDQGVISCEEVSDLFERCMRL